MSAFRVGMRVKKVALYNATVAPDLARRKPDEVSLGSEGIIVLRDSYDRALLPWCVHYDRYGDAWASDAMLAPLLDPRADAFIEKIKKLATQPVMA